MPSIEPEQNVMDLVVGFSETESSVILAGLDQRYPLKK
jgi:hypothetical protein